MISLRELQTTPTLAVSVKPCNLRSLSTSDTTASMRPFSRASTTSCSALPHRTTNWSPSRRASVLHRDGGVQALRNGAQHGVAPFLPERLVDDREAVQADEEPYGRP